MYDVVIVGAGVAGSALAARLGRQGRKVLAIERDLRPPQLFVGELLQPGGVASLRALGLGGCVEGIDAQPTRGFAVISADEQQALSYPAPRGSIGESGERGPTTGYAFHHGRFVDALRRAAMDVGAVELRCGTVCRLLHEDGHVCGVAYRDRDGTEQHVHAALVIAADGRSSRIRRVTEGPEPYRMSHSAGVLLRGTALPYPGHGHVFVTQPAPILGYQISSDEVRLLVDIPGELPGSRGEGLVAMLRQVVAPQLPVTMREAFLAAIAEQAPRVMPTYQLAPDTSMRQPGLIFVGDAHNMRHPLTGSGMTAALHDVRLLAEQLADVDLEHRLEVEQRAARYYAQREPLTRTIDMLSGALYQVFRGEEPGLLAMREAMLRYWKLGGVAASGPMALLAGMSPRPSLLMMHYLGVALLGLGTNLAPRGMAPAELIPDVKTASKLALSAFQTIRPQLRRAFAPL